MNEIRKTFVHAASKGQREDVRRGGGGGGTERNQGKNLFINTHEHKQ